MRELVVLAVQVAAGTVALLVVLLPLPQERLTLAVAVAVVLRRQPLALSVKLAAQAS
jgi:hypothetical protein